MSPIDSSIDLWSKKLINDLEKVSFSLYPELSTIKDYLYSSGAIYASMSGSGSSVYGLFKKDPNITAFRDYWIWNSIL